MYCVLYHINQKSIKKNPQRVNNLKTFENQFDFSSIKFPASLHEVKKVEKLLIMESMYFTMTMKVFILFLILTEEMIKL